LLKQNPRGYVLNFDGVEGGRIHEVGGCAQIERSNTTSFRKLCSASLRELDGWFRDRTGKGLRMRRCQQCDVPTVGVA
jgi:hypothetical protein